MIKKSLCGLTPQDILKLLETSGTTHSHAVSILKTIYKEKTGDISKVTNIPKLIKTELVDKTYGGIFQPVASVVSKDKSVKYLFRTEKGLEFETVYIPDNKRNTVCVSSQAGCRMGCSFCVTGKLGFHGNLSAGEILNQVLSIPEADKINHVVFMGMGEPLDNIENVLKACEIITAEWGLAISRRNVTLSTVGITPGIKKFLLNSGCNLTLSIFSPFPEERKKVIPVEKVYPMLEIFELMRKYPINKRRRLSIAYVMIKDQNDSDSHLKELKILLKGSLIRINLLPFHSVEGDPYVSSPAERMQFFKHNLVVSGISASIRKSRGEDIFAACGLLARGLN